MKPVRPDQNVTGSARAIAEDRSDTAAVSGDLGEAFPPLDADSPVLCFTLQRRTQGRAGQVAIPGGGIVGLAQGNSSDFMTLGGADPHRAQRRAHRADDGVGVDLSQGVHPVAGQREECAPVVTAHRMRFIHRGIDGSLV